ncbi:MAG: glycerophosphodiester phosphodiesterase [Candidatus Thorarchaeota archaeon]|nr:glycerophosphodiester phosphodiesterase [Candidatus Thorarchaeota archaeon]
MMRPLVIGHRGAPRQAPENTIRSFETAYSAGADWVELDVQQTSDGRLVCIHDYDLTRLCGVEVQVAETDYAELSKYDIGSGERVPLLSQVLDLCTGARGVNVELKVPGVEIEVAELLRERGLVKRSIVSSFFHAALVTMHEVAPEVKTAILYNSPMEDPVEAALRVHASAVNPPVDTLDRRLVDRAHERGLRVYPWTVNDEAGMLRLVSWGTDGIITDVPDVCARAVRAP